MATDLQFDREESAGSSAKVCVLCTEAITTRYYTVNGKPVCERCRGAVEQLQRGGSPVARVLKATLFGFGAAVAGSIIYYAVAALTGMEIGLIAILVGFMVGAAVRKGCEGRGGWGYQSMAILLTYVSVVTSYIPFYVKAIREASANEGSQIILVDAGERKIEVIKIIRAATGLGLKEAKDLSESPRAAIAVRGGSAEAEKTAAELQAAGARVELPSLARAAPPPTGPIETCGALVILVGLILAAPLLAGFSNILGWVIIGIALYEAWMLNRKPSFEIAGPFQAGAA